MRTLKPITIVGGGLAGLTLGIGLRQRGVAVTIWEAGSYPRHRVCGELISGRGQGVLERLRLTELMAGLGARPARTAAFFLFDKVAEPRTLPEVAVGVSRFALDAALANRLRALGGELRTGERWAGVTAEAGTVLASGRRLKNLEQGWRWFGLKAHARSVALTADLEMHFSANSYVGLCRLDGDEVNVCGLFRRHRDEQDVSRHWQQRLCGEPGSALNKRLADAAWVESSNCAVAGLSLEPQSGVASAECRVGDALTMIAPVTGNGMSVAFESAELALDPLAAYARGETDWATAQREVARRCDEAFARRLRWASFLQRMMFQPMARTALMSATARSSVLWRLLFRMTR